MNSETLKHAIDLSAAALAPITAIVALSITYRQYRLEKLKVRRELYERRFEIYTSTMKLLAHILQQGKAEDGQLFKFFGETQQSYFLFGKEIDDYLRHLYKQGCHLRLLYSKLYDPSGMPTLLAHEERCRVAKEEGELCRWFSDQFDVAREKFAKHLRLDE